MLYASLLMGLLYACAGISTVRYNNPKSVVKAYYHALGSQDYEQLFRLGTPEAQQVFNQLRNMYALLPEGERRLQQETAQAITKPYRKVQCTVENNTAICDLCCDAQGQPFDAPLTLKRINKQWLIHMPLVSK